MPHPKRLGRKAGQRHGMKARRQRPGRVDERHDAPLPAACPGCGGTLRSERDRLKCHNERLKHQLDAARRAGFRQPAPFAKDRPQDQGAAGSPQGGAPRLLDQFAHLAGLVAARLSMTTTSPGRRCRSKCRRTHATKAHPVHRTPRRAQRQPAVHAHGADEGQVVPPSSWGPARDLRVRPAHREIRARFTHKDQATAGLFG